MVMEMEREPITTPQSTEKTTQKDLAYEIAYAEGVKLQISQLINDMAARRTTLEAQNDDASRQAAAHLNQLIPQLNSMHGMLATAISSKSPLLPSISATANGFLQTHYATITSLGKEETEEKEQKKAAEAALLLALAEAAAEAAAKMKALFTAKTRLFMQENIRGFDKLNDWMQDYFSGRTTDFLNSSPYMRQLHAFRQAIENNPELTGYVHEHQKAAETALTHIDKENGSKAEIKQQLEVLRELVGNHIPPELIAIDEGIKSGKTSLDEAAKQLKELVDKTRHTVDAMYERALHFSQMDCSAREALDKHFHDKGLSMDGTSLREFVASMEKDGRLSEDNLNRIARELEEKKGDVSALSEDDRLTLAAAQLKMDMQTLMTLHNLTGHIQQAPEKHKKKMQEKDAPDVDDIRRILEGSGKDEQKIDGQECVAGAVVTPSASPTLAGVRQIGCEIK